MKKITHFLALVVCLLLTGCDDDRYIKQIQAKFDNANPTGDKGVCFSVRGIHFPYISTYIPSDQEDMRFFSFWHSSNNYRNEVLHAFAQIGFLSEQIAGKERGRSIYRYNLTELGGKYYRKDKWLEGGFCFGRVKITSLNHPKSEAKSEVEYLSGEGMKTMYYNYEFDGIPEWATQNAELLKQSYSEILIKLETKKGKGTYTFVRYRNSKDKSMKEWHAAGGSSLVIL